MVQLETFEFTAKNQVFFSRLQGVLGSRNKWLIKTAKDASSKEQNRSKQVHNHMDCTKFFIFTFWWNRLPSHTENMQMHIYLFLLSQFTSPKSLHWSEVSSLWIHKTKPSIVIST
jgi:hypothetical protein